MREVCASAPAKVNLTLRVGEPSRDGYHPLVTVFEALHLREYVTVHTSKTPGIRIETTAHLPGGGIDEDTTSAMRALPADSHLAGRAAKVLQKLAMAGPWAATAAGVAITVDKHIPMAGGMAGGSADAAAALVACNELWELGLSPDQLERIGRTLGADVPACLMGGIALGTGRGDHMELLAAGNPAPGEGGHHWAIALAHGGLSTPEAFAALDAAGGPQGSWKPLEPLTGAERTALTGTAHDLAPALVNDLEEMALRLRPELGDTVEAARRAGALAVHLCGSGPSIAALASDADHARFLAHDLASCKSVKAVLATSGPAEGARIEAEGTR